MTVERNVAFGLTREQVKQGVVAETLELMHMQDLAHRRPHELSAGQAQRVALARALAPKPRLLLFDEPFSSLDAELRVRVRQEVAALMRELQMTAIFVTHDQEEAFTLGDDVAILRAGRIVQFGTPAQIYAEPASPWVAKFLGDANLLSGTVDGGHAATVLGRLRLAAAAPRSACVVLARPEHIHLTAGGPGVIRGVEFYGHDTVYSITQQESELRVRATGSPKFGVGEQVALSYQGPPVVSYPV
jgi:iron(III) transport system ATP-binding protein